MMTKNLSLKGVAKINLLQGNLAFLKYFQNYVKKTIWRFATACQRKSFPLRAAGMPCHDRFDLDVE